MATFRQMNYAVFAGEPVPGILFQPRIEPWYAWHQTFNCIPDAYRGMDLRQWFDHLGVSMRYVDYYTDMPRPIIETWGPDVTIREQPLSPTEYITVYETPYGELVQRSQLTQDKTWRTVDFPVKRQEDLKKLRWLYARRRFSFSPECFEQGAAFIGERGEPQFWITRSPYQALAVDWMPYRQFVYALTDAPEEVEATLAAIDAAYDSLYEEIISYGEVKIINFGENIHGHLITRSAFKRYLLPHYEKRSNQLREAGIFTHIHIDGAVRPLLPLLADLPFDGLEALTPEPQGDVTLEEIGEHIGDKILLDGIPAVLFMETYSREQLMATVERLVELFYPRLVLGVSDEVPEGSSVDAIERVRMIAEWCRDHEPSVRS
ncbi:MAG: hypothetical protein JXJ20_13325 [Anaerolineae bacterium]|nr:hypothetical protein [Anaerolineae bacterium]